MPIGKNPPPGASSSAPGVPSAPRPAMSTPASGAPAARAKMPAKVPDGLITDVAAPQRPVAQAVAARQIAAPFESFMKVRTFEVDIARPGQAQVETVVCHALSGPGHNCSIAAPLMLDEHGLPRPVLKAGDTRAARTLRGEAYVKIGLIGGRWDKVGADAEAIGIDEIAEEIGADMVKGGYLPLGDKLVPTMPHESTEADRYFAAIVRVDADDKATGDMSGMEVVGLMKPQAMTVQSALQAMDDGSIGEGARARVAYGRALDKIGFIPELAAYVHDLPGALKKRFSTLGLGAPRDPRQLPAEIEADQGGHGAPPAPHEKAAEVDGVKFVSRDDVPIDGSTVMLDAETAHLAKDTQVGGAFQNQILHVGYDRAKVVTFHDDPVQGPMVRLRPTPRPVMAAKGLAMDDERSYKDENVALLALDVDELAVDLEGAVGTAAADAVDGAVTDRFSSGSGGAISRLGAPCDASPGQSDLRYHFYVNQVDAPPAGAEKSEFIRLADAIELCRGGEGDAATEAALLRLATRQRWLPQLGMSVDRAAKLAG